MTKDFANKKRHTPIIKINHLLLLASVFVIVLGGISLMIYKYGNHYQHSQPSLYVARVSAWIEAHKHHGTKINEHLNSLKTVKIKHTPDASPIHFEFYSVLPDMEMSLSESKPTNEQKLVSANQKSIANVEDLERDLSSTIKDTSTTNHIIKQKRVLK